MGCSESSAFRQIYSTECIYQKRKSKINHLSFHLRKLEKEMQTKLKENRKKELDETPMQSKTENREALARPLHPKQTRPVGKRENYRPVSEINTNKTSPKRA